jgi:Tfp pilus assembly protein PilF
MKSLFQRSAMVLVLAAFLAAFGGCGTQGSSGMGSRSQSAAELQGEEHFQKALGYEAQEQWELAKQEYRLAIKQRPNDSRAYVNLGQLYSRDGETERAEECWRQALRVNPRDARALNLLGSVYFRQKQYDLAIASYRKALEADPNYANAHWNLAVAYRTVDMKREAADHYRRYIDLAPGGELDDIVEARRYIDSYNSK